MSSKKVVINNAYGGFGLSDLALSDLGLTWDEGYNIKRDDENLIKLIELCGVDYVGDSGSSLSIVEITKEFYRIEEYDGLEYVLQSDSPIEYVR